MFFVLGGLFFCLGCPFYLREAGIGGGFKRRGWGWGARFSGGSCISLRRVRQRVVAGFCRFMIRNDTGSTVLVAK